MAHLRKGKPGLSLLLYLLPSRTPEPESVEDTGSFQFALIHRDDHVGGVQKGRFRNPEILRRRITVGRTGNCGIGKVESGCRESQRSLGSTESITEWAAWGVFNCGTGKVEFTIATRANVDDIVAAQCTIPC